MARILIVTILVVLLAACTSVTGSGNLVNRSFDVDGFSRIDASHGAQVEVTRGEAFSVDVEVVTAAEIWNVVNAEERGDYRQYATLFRHFLDKAPLQQLIDMAGQVGFVDWLRLRP